MRVAVSQTAFNAGLLGKNISRRVTIDQYTRGCRTLDNFMVAPEGAAIRRRGTVFVQEVKDSTEKARLIPFIFSNIDSYVMQFNDGFIRFYRNRGLLTETPKNITNITQTNPAVVTSSTHGFSNGDEVIINNVVGMSELNGRRFIVANKTANTFELSGENATGYTAYSSGGTAERIYQIASPYTEAMLPDIKYVQEGDVMYLVSGGTTVRPQKITRNSNGTFTIGNMNNLAGPIVDGSNQLKTITIQPSATTGTITVTASASLFLTGHVGGVWGIRAAAASDPLRYFRITGYTSATQVTAVVLGAALGGTGATGFYAAAEWDGVRGYPRAIAFHEQRLVLAGTQANPLGVFFSRSNANYENFNIGNATASDAFTATLSGRVNNIQWLVSESGFLLAGTTGGIAYIGSSASSDALSVSNIKVNNGENYPSSKIQGVFFSSGIKYVQDAGLRLFQTQYDDIALKYKAIDISILNPDVTQSGIVYMDFQTQPFDVLYMITQDGSMVGFTQEEEQAVRAFQRITTDGNIESIAVIPKEGVSQVWLCIRREIDGNTVRYVEFIESDDIDYYVDCGLTYDGSVAQTLTLSAVSGSSVTATAGGAAFSASDVGRRIFGLDGGRATITAYTSPTVVTVSIQSEFPAVSLASSEWRISATTFSGLSHLEGKTVQVLGDGSYAGEYVVSGGEITIPNEQAAGLAYVGLQYISDMRPMAVEAGSIDGSDISKQKRINRIAFSLLRSGGFKFGSSFNNLTILPTRKTNDFMDTSVPYYGVDAHEDIVRAFPSNWTRDASICVRQDLPLPLTVLALTAYMETNDA